MEAQVKQCKKCNEIKPLDDFYRDRTRKDGREWMCKRCKEAYKKEKRERKRRVNAAEATTEIKPEPKETIFMPKLQEEYKCSFCGEIRKEADMAWYDEDAPFSDDGSNICADCYERKE